jgi:plasmid stabilization system protein ParE
VSENAVPVRLTRKAENDLRVILAFVEEQRPVAADRLAARFTEAAGHLSMNPRLGKVPAVARLSRRGFRCLVVEEYLCFYKITTREVLIHRVIHGARNYPGLL